MIKNIIFDMGNVLLKFSPKEYVKWFDLTKEEQNKLYYATFKNWRCPFLDKGTYTEEEFVKEVNKELPEKFHPMVHKLIFDWAEKVFPVEGMADFVKQCKDKGYKIYLLSNAGYRQHEYWLKIPGHEYFDGTIVSCDYNTIKPEPKIYQELFDKFNLKPEECYFIDDLPINIYGAKMQGMNGFVFHGDVVELKNEFIKLGLL